MIVHQSEPEWLARWKRNGFDQAEALRCFDAAAPVSVEDVIGVWTGRSLPTNHPLDHALETLGWYGKAFRSENDVDPLLFRSSAGKNCALDPGRLPAKLAVRFAHLASASWANTAFRLTRPLLVTGRPAARLRLVSYRRTQSVAMIYDRQPIIDHFRKVTENHLVGLMDMRSLPRPYFFLLTRT